MRTCKRSADAYIYVFLLKEVRILPHDVGQVTFPQVELVDFSLDHFVWNITQSISGKLLLLSGINQSDNTHNCRMSAITQRCVMANHN